MATWTGSSTVGTDATTGRIIRMDWTVDSTDPDYYSTSIGWRLRISVYTGGQSIDSNNSFNISGSWSRSGSVAINTPSGGGSQQIYDSGWAYDTGLGWGSTSSRSFSASLSGVAVVTGRDYPAISISTQSFSRTVPTPSAPSAPQSFSASAASVSQINLSWSAPASDGGVPVTGYTLVRNGTTVFTNSNVTSYSDTGLSPYTSYSYTVAAVNGAGTGATASASATTLGGIARIWNGTSYVTVLPKVWNGSAWVDAQARIWNGTEWKYGI